MVVKKEVTSGLYSIEINIVPVRSVISPAAIIVIKILVKQYGGQVKIFRI